MRALAQIGLVVFLATLLPQQETLQDYLRSLIGQGLILRHYAGSQNIRARQKDLSHLRGGCDEAVKVVGVVSDGSSIQFQLRNIGTPIIVKKEKGCTRDSLDVYLLSITELVPNETQNAIASVLQTPEAYLASYGVKFDHTDSLDDAQPVNYPGPGLTAPKPVLTVNPYYSDASRKARREGTVAVRCVIGTDGRIYSPFIEKGVTEELDKLALDALSFWRLEPVRQGPRPVAAKVPIEISFRMLS